MIWAQPSGAVGRRRPRAWEITLADLSALILCIFVVAAAVMPTGVSADRAGVDPAQPSAVVAATALHAPVVASSAALADGGPAYWQAALERRLAGVPGAEVRTVGGSTVVSLAGDDATEPIEQARRLLRRLSGLPGRLSVTFVQSDASGRNSGPWQQSIPADVADLADATLTRHGPLSKIEIRFDVE